jgi:hypothetical protein
MLAVTEPMATPYPTGLPVLYDLTDPASNLADYDGVMPDFLSDNRFLWGTDLALAYFAGMYGYSRHRSFLPALAWALAGYMAPMPVAGVVAWEVTSGKRTF